MYVPIYKCPYNVDTYVCMYLSINVRIMYVYIPMYVVRTKDWIVASDCFQDPNTNTWIPRQQVWRCKLRSEPWNPGEHEWQCNAMAHKSNHPREYNVTCWTDHGCFGTSSGWASGERCRYVDDVRTVYRRIHTHVCAVLFCSCACFHHSYARRTKCVMIRR